MSFRRRKEPDVAAAPVPLEQHSADPESHLDTPDERRAYVAEDPLPHRGGPATERESGSDYFVIPRSVLERWRRAEA
jgi:hypothetical protein